MEQGQGLRVAVCPPSRARPAPLSGETEMEEMPGMFRDWKDMAEFFGGVVLALLIFVGVVYLGLKGAGIL
jgi:hypothetical protein